MFRKTLAICSIVAFAVSLAAAADTPRASSGNLTAAQIVDKNVSARGGLQAWRAVQALEMSGKMDAGGNNQRTIPVPGTRIGGANMPPRRPSEPVQLPFVMDLQRPRKMRVEIQFQGQTALQVYDGSKGWKLRPFLNRHEVEPFTAEELKAAGAQSDLDGPLIDFAAKGSKVELEGLEKVDGRNAYNLKVTDKGGHVRHVWIDAESFLESKIEGTPRRLDGKYHPVAVYFRDYKAVNGLMMPYVLETAVEGVKETEKIQIEKIVLNPKLDEARFAMPR
ncbi:MAG: outer membrane lipoprotein-sorting protein [Acidobacteriia bacterium]|nr:outer membrane lipoprotein-sorting protein [Terriglobia bacterium]